MSSRPPHPRPRHLTSGGSLLLAGVLLVTACSPGTPTEDTGDAGDAALQGSTASPSPSPEDAEPFTIAFGGDVMFEGILEPRLNDPATAMGPVASQLSAADLAMVNLETAVTEGGTPAPNKRYVFRAPATALEALDAAGVDVASVANNHGMDYGEAGLADTLANGEASPVALVGAGNDADEAYTPHIAEVNGQTVALFGATDVLDDHLIGAWTAGEGKPGLASVKGEARQRMLVAVSEAAAEVDNVVVFLHWGLEGSHCPIGHAPTLAQELIDVGADAVVGGHAHVLSPGGFTGDSYVHYGLGNFVFYNFDGPTAESGVLTLTFDDGRVTGSDWAPARIQGGVPVPYEGTAADQPRQTWVDMRNQCGLPLTDSPA